MTKIYARRVKDIPIEYRDPDVDYDKYADQAIYVDESCKPISGNVPELYDTSNVTWWTPSLKSTGLTQLEESDLRMIDKRKGDEYASQYSAGNIFSSGLLAPMNFFSPSQLFGAIIDYAQGEKGYWEGIGKGNSGFVTDKFAEDHPWWTMAANGIGDAATGYGITKGFQNLSKLSRLEKWYTGVPHNEIKGNPTLFMDEQFPNYKGTRWLSDNKDYARSFGSKNYRGIGGTEYTVYVDPKELKSFVPPKVKTASDWLLLPYKISNGKLVKDPNFRFTHKSGFTKSENNLPWDFGEDARINDKVTAFKEKFGYDPMKTDDVINFAKDNGYNSTKLSNILDGALTRPDETIYVRPINELILHENAPSYLGNSKFDIMKLFDWKPTQFTYFSTLGGLNGSYNKN